MHRRHVDATSSKKTGAPASGYRLPYTLTEDVDRRNLLTLGLDLNWSLSTKVKENHSKTVGKFDLTFPKNHSNAVHLRT